MGYDFSFEDAGEGQGASFRLNSSEMSMMREFMREVGAVAEAGQHRAMATGGAEDSLSVSLSKFTSNSNWHVTPQECRTIASRLRAGLSTVREVASFFDDAPSGPELERWVLSWVEFNERAANCGGYRIR